MTAHTRRLGSTLGNGAENTCTEVLGKKGSKPETVLRYANFFGKAWQTQGRAFAERCLRVLEEHQVITSPQEIHENLTLLLPNGKRTKVPLAFETPYIDEIEKLRVKFKDIKDPEKGPETIRRLVEIVKSADKIYRNEQLGLDPYGGEIILDVLKGVIQVIILKISSLAPVLIQKFINSKIEGIPGQMRNLIFLNGDIVLIDPGMHNFSEEEGKFTPITKNIHHIMFATLIEVLVRCNRELPQDKRLPEEELTFLPFNGPAHIRLLSKLIADILIPLIERYDKLHPNN